MFDQMANAAAAAAEDIDGFGSVGVERMLELKAVVIARIADGEREFCRGEGFEIGRGREPTADSEASLLKREERTRWRNVATGEARCVDARLKGKCGVD